MTEQEHIGSVAMGDSRVEAIVETPAQEFERLVREYREDTDGPTAEEAWNLIADFSVENFDNIYVALEYQQTFASTAALSFRPAQEPVGDDGRCPRPCNGRPDDFSMRACIEAGECGCIAFTAPQPATPTHGTSGLPDTAPQGHVMCSRCQGNGEIVTDWARYRRAQSGDKGDEAVTECPDCGGEGIIDSAPLPAPNVLPPVTAGQGVEALARAYVAMMEGPHVGWEPIQTAYEHLRSALHPTATGSDAQAEGEQ